MVSQMLCLEKRNMLSCRIFLCHCGWSLIRVKEAVDNDLILNAIKQKISMDGVATRQYTLNNGMMDCASQGVNLVPKPKLDTYVVCRSKKFLGAVLLDDSGEEQVYIEADDLYAMPCKSIKSLVESGQIDLV
ncbi:uncharacterized protein [Primulina huaijiensis]|uniref:uncharacterized protein n=1 Tax=Primulina huaijiensis TaxID=1492673 RepID=UPI003CC720E5